MHWAWITLLSILLVLVLFLVSLKLITVLTLGKCSSTRRLDGKVALITGANRGIGYHTALNLAKRGAKLIITGTNVEVLNQAQKQLIEESGNEKIIAKPFNLNTLAAVREFARDIINTEPQLDILINNASSFGQGHELKKDGMIPVMQINYFGPFLLTILLIDLLKKSAPSRVVNVSSGIANFSFCFDSHNLNTVKHLPHSALLDVVHYASSKLCTAASSIHLAQRLRGARVAVNCLHPGLAYTGIYKHRAWSSLLADVGRYICMKTPEEGAQTTIHVATCETIEGVTGKYYRDCRPSWITANLNSTVRSRVWEQSVKLTGLTPEELSVFNTESNNDTNIVISERLE